MLTTRPQITDTAIECLQDAAVQLQAHYINEEGQCYPVEWLVDALVAWIEGSIEEMANDAVFHCIEGRDDYAFNRHAFRKAMQKLSEKYATKSVSRSDRPCSKVSNACSRLPGGDGDPGCPG